MVCFVLLLVYCILRAVKGTSYADLRCIRVCGNGPSLIGSLSLFLWWISVFVLARKLVELNCGSFRLWSLLW